MDPELKKGFQELQAQVIESRSRISNIETCQKLTTHDAKINDQILNDFSKGGDIESKFFYQPVGRMLVRQEGKVAHDFLLERQKQYQERLKEYKETKEICLNRVKESENTLRELVNKKLNKSDNNQTTTKQDIKETVEKSQGSEIKSKPSDRVANATTTSTIIKDTEDKI